MIKKNVDLSITLSFMIVITCLVHVYCPSKESVFVPCNNPNVRQPVVVSDFHWPIFLCVCGLIFFATTTATTEWYFNYNRVWLKIIRLFLFVAIGFCLLVTVTILLSRSVGALAPNFIDACKPANFSSSCKSNTSQEVVQVHLAQCTTSSSSWIPAVSASPSHWVTYFTYIVVIPFILVTRRVAGRVEDKRTKVYRWILFSFISAVEIGMIVAVMARNEANTVHVFIGTILGGATAMLVVSGFPFINKEDETSLIDEQEHCQVDQIPIQTLYNPTAFPDCVPVDV